MNLDNCYLLGHVSKVKGMNGEVVVFLDVDQPEDYQEIDSVYLELNGQLIPFFIETCQVQNKYAVLKFEDIDSLDAALKLVKSPLYLPFEILPQLKGKAFYFHEIIGFSVEDIQGNSLGIIEDVLDFPANLLFQIKHPNGKEILIPAQDQFITDIDRKIKKIKVCPPEGLVEMYLDI